MVSIKRNHPCGISNNGINEKKIDRIATINNGNKRF